MKKLDITRSAGRFLKKLPPKQFRQVVLAILSLRTDSSPHDSKKLIGSADFRRIDIGECRVIYRIEGDVVKVAVVGKRNDDEVYRKFNQL